jgi:ATP-dependent protease Clp ATPase subunit
MFGLKHSRWTRCSFCRKYHNEVAKLISGDNCFICNECVMVCFNVLINALGDEFKPLNEQIEARRRGAIEGELRWLKEQHMNGLITEEVYHERQVAVLRGQESSEASQAEQAVAHQPA